MFVFTIDNEVLVKCSAPNIFKTGVANYADCLNREIYSKSIIWRNLEDCIRILFSYTRSHRVLNIYQSILLFKAHFYIKKNKNLVLHKPWYGKWHKSLKGVKNLRKILTIHDCIAFEHPEWFDANVFAHLLKWTKCIEESDFFIFVSESSRADFLKRFPKVSQDKTSVTLLGPTINNKDGTSKMTRSDLYKQFGISADRPYFLSVCTLEPRKNLARLIEAFALFKMRTLSPASLILTGAQGWGGDLSLIIQNCKMSPDDVIFTGYVKESVLPSLYNNCLAFVYPSLYEGFGLPVLDALKMGAAVISSNISSIPEVTGEAAILIDPYNIDELSFALERVVCDLDFCMSLKKAARERAVRFSWETCGRATLDAYKASLEN